MKSFLAKDHGSIGQVNIPMLLDMIRRNWILTSLSLAICIIGAMAYAKLSTPKYEVGASLLIASGKDRSLGESRLIEGTVGLIETEKNLLNEIAVLKSYELIEQTIDDLNFQVSYLADETGGPRERYGDFPVTVELLDSNLQLIGTPFYFKVLQNNRFELTIDVKNYRVFNPVSNTTKEIEESFKFSGAYPFGVEVRHKYFRFNVHRSKGANLNLLEEETPLFFQVHTKSGITSKYLSKLDVTRAGPEATILDLRIVGASVNKEVDFLNRLCKNYIIDRLEKRDQIAINKAAFLRNQLSAISDSLDLAERRLEYFKRQSQSIDLKQLVSNSLNKIQDLESDQAKLEFNLKYYKAQLDGLNDSNAEEKITAPSVIGIDDPLLNNNLLELKDLYRERERLSFIKGQQSIDMEILNQRIQSTKNSVRQNLQNIIHTTELALNDVVSRVESLETSIDQVPRSQKQLLSFERKRNLYENLFIYLSQELAKAGIAQAEDIPDIRVLNQARMIGNGPVSPKKKLILMLGLVMGCLVPFGWIVFRYSFNDLIESEDQIEQSSDIPVIATIIQHRESSLLADGLSKWEMEEAFRDLAAKMHYLSSDGRNNVIGITSVLPGEGKSFCASNLAIQLANSGKKVLLINLDFRKPEPLPINPKKKKFSAYLNWNRINIESVVHRWVDVDNLYYIPIDQVTENPQKFLSSHKMVSTIQHLSSIYDCVILDTPAIGVVSDYLLISKIVDINLFLLRYKVSRRGFLKELERLPNPSDKNYIVFNGAPKKKHKYGYADYYYSSSSKKVENGSDKRKFNLSYLLDKITPN